MEAYKFNNIIDTLADYYNYTYEPLKDGKFLRFDKLTEETETVNSYTDIIKFYLEQYQNKTVLSGGNEYEKIIEALQKLLNVLTR